MEQKNTLHREYRKPSMEQVRLIAQESVLAECKNASQTGPDGANCNVLGQCPNVS